MKTKIIIFILAGILVLALAGVILLHHILPGKVVDGLQKVVAQMSEGEAAGLYQLEIEKVTFSPLFRTMHVSSFMLVPDTQMLVTLKPEALPAEIFRIHAGGLAVSTGGLIALARQKDEIVFSNVQLKELAAMVIRNPAMKMPENREEVTEKADEVSEKEGPLPEKAEEAPAEGKKVPEKAEEAPPKDGDPHPMQSLEIKSFSVAFSSLKVQMLEALGSDVFSLHQGQFSGGFLWQSEEGQEAPKLDMRNPAFWVAKLDIRPPGDLHRFACDSLALGGDGSVLELFGMEVIPKFSKRQFTNQITHQTDRFEANLDTVRFSGFDLNKLINQKYLSAEKLEVSHGQLEVFRDRHPPFNTKQRPTMPVRRIMQAPFKMWLGTTQINNLDVFYQELPEESSEEGVIPFMNLSATLTNMTNAGELLMQDSIMHLEARARMFGRASLTASFAYNLQDINGGYNARGTLAAMPFTVINQAMFPLTGIQVMEGAHEKTNFSFTGNDFRSDGKLTMLYSGLKLDLAPDRSRLRQNITNWAGRQFVYHASNPGNDGEVRPGIIDFEREIDRFVFHYWWNCFLTGAGSTVMKVGN